MGALTGKAGTAADDAQKLEARRPFDSDLGMMPLLFEAMDRST